MGNGPSGGGQSDMRPDTVLNDELPTAVESSQLPEAWSAAGQRLKIVSSRGEVPGKPRDPGWILLDMIEEYARHNGHVDLKSEAIDGTTGD